VTEKGRYLYVITRGVTQADLVTISGLRAVPLDVVEHTGLSAVVSDVDLEEFGEDALRRNLEDLPWLEEVARGHDAVVQAVADLAPAAPVRLATICRDDDGVRLRLEEWKDGLRTALDRVTGRREWSIKAFMPQRETSPSAERAEIPSGPGAGAAYLQRKRDETNDRQSAEENALGLADETHAALSAMSVASRRLAPQDPRLSGHDGTMMLNGAYLVEIDEEDAFAATVEELAAGQPEIRLAVQGPWPPYSFATLEQE
jgi:hypothetical protein